MPTIQINAQSIYFEEYGNGEPLVLIAGLGASCNMWWKQIEPLSEKFRVVIFDNRGIGNSSRVKEAFGIKEMAVDLATLISTLEIAPCHLSGISMGGFIALTLAQTNPELINKLILISTSAGGADFVAPKPQLMDEITQRSQMDSATYYRTIYEQLAGPDYMQNHPEDLDRIVANFMEKPISPETYLYQLNAVNEFTSPENTDVHLEQLNIKTLVIHGDADNLVPLPNGKHLAHQIKGAKLISYKHVGHLVHIEAADQLNRDIIEFLQR